MRKTIKVTLAVLLTTVVVLVILNTITTRSLKTEIIIDAPSDEVWSVLMNHEAYPDWNPFIKHISGSTKPGEFLETTLQEKEMIPWISTLLFSNISITRSLDGKGNWE